MLITSNLKYLILLIGSWITTFLIVGICMLDVLIATNFLTFIGLIVIYLFGVVIFSQYFKVNSVFKQIAIGGGLIIYFLISVFFQKSDFIYMPPLISLFAFYIPFMLIYFNLHRVFHIIFILWFNLLFIICPINCRFHGLLHCFPNFFLIIPHVFIALFSFTLLFTTIYHFCGIHDILILYLHFLIVH